ncbi:MAG TPA: peptidylprolyl isomerase [Gemmataceae bacterium]|nr:peptidylprolyl isomerase [Gemmataceae bacterium]
MSLRTRCALLILFAAAPAIAAEKIAATVNGEPITVAELDAALAQIPAPTTPLSATQKRQQRIDALQILTDDLLVRQFLKQHGPKVEPAEVDRQLAALAASEKAQGKTLEEYLKETGLTVPRIRENFLRMLQLANYVESQATDERLRQYFETNRDLFDKTTVRTSHIVLRAGANASTEERQKATQKLRAIRTELETGKTTFAAAAKAHSQCPSAPNGGDLGYLVRKFQMDEAYARAAFSLKVGEVSDVIETPAGYHLIWLTDRKPGKPSRYEDVAPDVRDCFEAEFKQNLLAELRKQARIAIYLKN